MVNFKVGFLRGTWGYNRHVTEDRQSKYLTSPADFEPMSLRTPGWALYSLSYGEPVRGYFITMLASSQCLSIITPRGSVPTADINTGFDPKRARHSVTQKIENYKQYSQAVKKKKYLNRGSQITYQARSLSYIHHISKNSLGHRQVFSISNVDNFLLPSNTHTVLFKENMLTEVKKSQLRQQYLLSSFLLLQSSSSLVQDWMLQAVYMTKRY